MPKNYFSPHKLRRNKGVATRVETMIFNYFSEKRWRRIQVLLFWKNNGEKGVVFEKTDDIFTPISAVSVKSLNGRRSERVFSSQ